MNIWQIQQDLLAIFDELEENGGELTEELEQKLAISQEDFRSKVESYTNVIKSIKADVAAIDEERKTLIIGNKGIMGCCYFNETTYHLSQIKKVRIFVTWKPDPKIGFNKLYFVNCEIYSLTDEKNDLFVDVPYEEGKFNQFIAFFQRHLTTEFEPIENAISAINVIPVDGNNTIGISPVDNPAPIDQVIAKPSINESAALPVASDINP
jgi:hypothetical protein